MPRTKLDKQPSKLVELIWGRAEAAGKSKTELAQIAGFSDETLRRRKKDPYGFTLNELSRISRGLHIPIEDMRTAITLK